MVSSTQHQQRPLLTDHQAHTPTGKELYSKTAGHTSPLPDAAPLHQEALLKLGSATKLMTSIALLQCIEAGHVGLDEPLSAAILPELRHKPILSAVDGTTLTTQPSATEITPRHLLSHTSGLGYWFTHPLLMKWRASGAQKVDSPRLTERFDYPLVFEPGQGWAYGCNLDWAGVAVSRMNGGVTLEEYMVENVWKRVGRTAPFPTFHLEKHPELEDRLMGAAERTAEGGLKASDGQSFCAHLEEDEGGAGLVLTMGDYVAVLQDLISDAPRLLKPETISMMFEPRELPPSNTKHHIRFF